MLWLVFVSLYKVHLDVRQLLRSWGKWQVHENNNNLLRRNSQSPLLSLVSQIFFDLKLFLRTVDDTQVRTTCEITFSLAMNKSKRQKMFINTHLSPMCYLFQNNVISNQILV